VAGGEGSNTSSSRAVCALLLAVGAITAFWAFNYDIFDIYVYYIPSYMVMACLMSFGASALLCWGQDRRGVSAATRARIAPLVAIVALAVPLVPAAIHYPGVDQSDNFVEDDFATNILRSSPPGALIITNDSVCFTLWYTRFVLHERPDAVPIHQGLLRGLIFWNAWYGKHLYAMYPDIVNVDRGLTAYALNERLRSGDYLIDLIRRALQHNVPVMIVPDARFDGTPNGVFPSFDQQLRAAGVLRIPWGICDRLFLPGHTPPDAYVYEVNRAIRPKFVARGIYDGSGVALVDPLQVHIPRRYLDADAAFAAVAERTGHYEDAVAALEQARKINPWPELQAAEDRCKAEAAASAARPGADSAR
jgi:hypothetical protein